MAAVIARSQLRTLKISRSDERIGPEDRRYLGNQASRRLLEATLMVVIAALLIGWLFLEKELQAVREQMVEPPSDHTIVRIVTGYWVFACAVLFLMLVLAGFDFVATAKYAVRHQRRIKDERNPMLASEVSRLRDKRSSNGNGRMNGEM